MMQTRTLTASLWLPAPPESVFPFFADARNLEAITPALLKFRVVSPSPIEMRVGAIIDYRLRLRGFPARWRTEITAWEPGRRFVDEQTRGPYRLWRHEHAFSAERDGTRCLDRVEYAHFPPRWLGGGVIHELLIRPDLVRIFGYRAEALMRRFGGGEAGPIDIRRSGPTGPPRDRPTDTLRSDA